MICAADAYAKSRLAPYKWHEYNDAHVREIQPEKVCTAEAYLLFYRRTGATFEN